MQISPLPFVCSPLNAGARLLRRLKNDVTKMASNFVKVAIQSPFNDKRYRPFPSSKQSHFQSEAKCEAIDMKMIFNYDANKIYFHNKGFALSLVLKVRFFGTRKWPIWLREYSP